MVKRFVLAVIFVLLSVGPSASAAILTVPGGNGTITFDGTFSTTDPASGPHWNSTNGTCYKYVSLQKLSMTPLASCSPSSHLRTDVNTSNSSFTKGMVYSKGSASCTTIPFYLPRQIPSDSGQNAWYQVVEMKDYTSPSADWGFGIAHAGVSGLDFSVHPAGELYASSTPVSAGIWHTASICTDNSTTIKGVWFDGNRLIFNKGTCSGKQFCGGLSIFYDGMGKQPLDINAYTGNTTGTDPYGGYTVVHGDPLIATIGSNGDPPEPPGGWNSP